MKILDPKKIQEYLYKHKQLLDLPREQVEPKVATQRLVAQIETVKEVVKNHDGSTLAALKRELNTLYERSLHAQVAHGLGQNFQLGNTFVIRLHEQEQLMLWELRTQLVDALGNMKAAVHRKDFMRMFMCLGGDNGGSERWSKMKYCRFCHYIHW